MKSFYGLLKKDYKEQCCGIKKKLDLKTSSRPLYFKQCTRFMNYLDNRVPVLLLSRGVLLVYISFVAWALSCYCFIVTCACRLRQCGFIFALFAQRLRGCNSSPRANKISDFPHKQKTCAFLFFILIASMWWLCNSTTEFTLNGS